MDPTPETRAVVDALSEAMRVAQITPIDVAAKLGMHHSKIYSFLKGRTKKVPAFVYEIAAEFSFDLPLRGAPRLLGQYSRSHFDTVLRGTHRTIIVSRGSTQAAPSFESYRTAFEWNRANPHATFREIGRISARNHEGRIAMYEGSNILYLLSNSSNGHGFRQICVNKKFAEKGNMCGFLSSTTQYAHNNVPFICQIAYLMDDPFEFRDTDGIHDMNSVHLSLLRNVFDQLKKEVGFSYGILS